MNAILKNILGIASTEKAFICPSQRLEVSEEYILEVVVVIVVFSAISFVKIHES